MLPKFPRDTTDRNRTSPFAFTGNKFEFRSLGSSASISDANVVLNTIVAEALRQFADELETAGDFSPALHDLIVRTIHAHKRIIFNGNNYSVEWAKEAERRGLFRLDSAVDALPSYTEEKNVQLFEIHQVLSASELRSRRDIGLDAYANGIGIEAKTMLMMAKRQILPAVLHYAGDLAASANHIRDAAISLKSASPLLDELCQEIDRLSAGIELLESGLKNCPDASAEPPQAARYMHDVVLVAMVSLRRSADRLEMITDRSYWPFPTYDELLFSVR